MPQDFRNGWKRRAFFLEPSGQSVPQRVEPPLLWAPKSDPRRLAPILDNVVEIVVVSERIKRRVHFEEYLSVCRLGTARLQVVDQGLADIAGQRQSQRRARLRLGDFYGRFRPTKVI